MLYSLVIHRNKIGTSVHTEVQFLFRRYVLLEVFDIWESELLAPAPKVWKSFLIAPYELCPKNIDPNEKVGGLASVLDNSWSPWRATSPTSADLFLTSQAVWSGFSPKYNCQCAEHSFYICLQKQPVLFETDGGMWRRAPRWTGAITIRTEIQ